MADSDAPVGALRAFLNAWALVLLQAAGLAAVCAGVAFIYWPAAAIVGGGLVIVAVERGGT